MRNGREAGIHEEVAGEVDDGDRRAVGRRSHGQAAPRRALRVVGRPHDAVVAREEPEDLALSPHVVAGGEHVDAAAEQLEGDLGGDAGTVRRVLAVDDDEVDVAVFARSREPRRSASRPGFPNTSPTKRMSHGRPTRSIDPLAAGVQRGP